MERQDWDMRKATASAAAACMRAHMPTRSATTLAKGVERACVVGTLALVTYRQAVP